MIAKLLRLLAVAVLTAPVMLGQFSMSVVTGGTENPVAAIYQMGSFQPGEAGSAHFRIRNTSAQAATLSFLSVAGSGFSLSGAPSLPLSLAAQQAVDFQVMFQANAAGAYSAALNSEGISVLLAATVVQSLTYEADSQALGTTVDFGGAEVGSSATKHFTILNQNSVALAIPAISVNGSGFSLVGTPPSGTVLGPQQTSGFDIAFQPAAAAASSGSLAIGSRVYALTGTALAIALPKPSLQVNLPQALSGQQGTVTVLFDAAARTGGSGVISLQFQPLATGSTDSGIQFASGGTQASFSVSPGDTQASIPFQTGTTAGTLKFSVTLGTNSDSKSVTIAAAAVTLSASQATRSAGTVVVQLTGFDNTRSVSRLVYTFYDASGNTIAPGALTVDSAADFTRFFQGSSAGGNFQLVATFPVTGDATKVAAFQAQIVNSAGSTQTARGNF
jgi:hypothetical protein